MKTDTKSTLRKALNKDFFKCDCKQCVGSLEVDVSVTHANCPYCDAFVIIREPTMMDWDRDKDTQEAMKRLKKIRGPKKFMSVYADRVSLRGLRAKDKHLQYIAKIMNF